MANEVTVVYIRLPDFEKQKELAEQIEGRMVTGGYRSRDNSNPSKGRKTVGLGGTAKQALLNEKFNNPGDDLKNLLTGGDVDAIPFRGVASRGRIIQVITDAINHLGFQVQGGGNQVVFLRQNGHLWNTGNYVHHVERGVVFALEDGGIGTQFFHTNGGFNVL